MDDSSTQVTVVDDGVEVARTIEDRSTDIIVVYRLESLTSAPSVVHLEETIPPADRIETLEFHPNYSPNEWTSGEECLQFDAIVPPDEGRMVVFGIDTDLEKSVCCDEPTFTTSNVENVDLADSTESTPLTRETKIGALNGDRSDLLGLVGGAEGSVLTTDTTSDEVLDLDDPNEAEGESATDDSAPTPDTADGEDGSPVEMDVESDSDGFGEAVDENADDRPDPVGAEGEEEPGHASEVATPVEEETRAEADAEFSADTELADDDELGTENGLEADDDGDGLDEPGTEMATNRSDEGPASGADPDSLVGQLLIEIRAGHASENELDALRSELGVDRAAGVRFRHVQSRMDDFEAYVDALEGIINTHGTAPEFIEDIERKLADLQDELKVVRGGMSTVEEGLENADDEREALTDRMAALEESVAEVTDDVSELTDLVETVDDRTAALEMELRNELDEVRTERDQQLEAIETELEEVHEQLETQFETEFETLREDVESLNEVRRSLLDAFGDGLDSTTDGAMNQG